MRRLIEPLIRFCLRHSFKFQDLLSVAKNTFVELAEEELSKTSAEVSVSRIAAITGLQRREVTRLLGSRAVRPSNENIIARVVAQWRHDERFNTSGGRPRVLQSGSKQSEFAELIKSVNKDLNPYTVLFELERLGYVEQTETGLRLKARLHSTAVDPETSLQLLAKDVSDLMQAVDQNIFRRDTVPNLHLRTEYDNIPADALPEIRAWLVREGTLFHERASSYLAGFDRDLKPERLPAAEKSRVTLGSFSWTEIIEQLGCSTTATSEEQ